MKDLNVYDWWLLLIFSLFSTLTFSRSVPSHRYREPKTMSSMGKNWPMVLRYEPKETTVYNQKHSCCRKQCRQYFHEVKWWSMCSTSNTNHPSCENMIRAPPRSYVFYIIGTTIHNLIVTKPLQILFQNSLHRVNTKEKFWVFSHKYTSVFPLSLLYAIEVW